MRAVSKRSDTTLPNTLESPSRSPMKPAPDEVDRHQRHAVRDAGIGVSHRAAVQHRALGAGESRGGDVDRLADPRRIVAQRNLATAAAAPTVPQVPCGCMSGRSEAAMPMRAPTS